MLTLSHFPIFCKPAFSVEFIQVLPVMLARIEDEWRHLRRDVPPSEDNEVDCLLRITHHCLGRLLDEADQ